MLLSLSLVTLIISELTVVFGTFCDDTRECEGSTITDWATCYGYYSCSGAKIDGTGATCSGMYGCRDAVEITTSSSSISCYGMMGCRGAGKMSSASSAYCDGYYSCYGIADKLTAESSIYCDGDRACSTTTMESGVDTSCNGNYACYSTTINADDDIYCDGDYGCAESELNAGDNVYCYGKSGCRTSTITSVDYTYSYGMYSTYGATISAERLYVYGYYSAAYSTMDSTDELAMNVYCYGYKGGFGADFICRSGSTCNLYCKGNCCDNLDYVCLSGSDCSVSCNDDSGDDCPTQQSPLASPSKYDNKLLTYLDDKKKDRAVDEFYIENEKEVKRDEERFNKKHDDIESNLKKYHAQVSSLSSFNGKSMISDKYVINSSMMIIALVTFIMTFAINYCYFSYKYKDYEYKSLN